MTVSLFWTGLQKFMNDKGRIISFPYNEIILSKDDRGIFISNKDFLMTFKKNLDS
jgi:hypothetical protein